jgi:hypothetical protein
MEEFFRQALGQLRNAASSNRALAAYAIVCISWVIVSIRVIRDKNLLKHIEKFPLRERPEVWRTQLAGLPLREGLSPEQFLRSRIHSYLFWAFLIACAAVVTVCVIAGVDHKASQDSLHSVIDSLNQKSKASDEDPIKVLTDKLNQLDLGESPQFLIQLFGNPNYVQTAPDAQRLIWSQPSFWLVVEVSDSKATSIVFTSRDRKLHPNIPFDKDIELGTTSFADLQTWKGLGYVPFDFGFSSKDFEFVSANPDNGTDELKGRYGYISYSGVGVDYHNNPTSQYVDILQAEHEMDDDKPGPATSALEQSLIPNSFAYHFHLPDADKRFCDGDDPPPVKDATQSKDDGQPDPKCFWVSLYLVPRTESFTVESAPE